MATLSEPQQQAVANATKGSRTVQLGVLSTGTSAAKATLTSRSIQDPSADSRLETTIRRLWQVDFKVLTDEIHWAKLTVAVNLSLRAWDDPFPVWRTWHADDLGYVPPSQIPAQSQAFYRKCASADSGLSDLAGMMYWNVNFRGHYFGDACGRTACVLACWLFFLGTGRVPDLPATRTLLVEAFEANSLNYDDWLSYWQSGPWTS